MTSQSIRLRELLARLVGAEARFVLVGGLAVRELDGKVDVDGRLLEGSAISTFLRTGDRTLVATELGQVDVSQGLPQVSRYAVLEDLEMLEAAQEDLGRGQ